MKKFNKNPAPTARPAQTSLDQRRRFLRHAAVSAVGLAGAARAGAADSLLDLPARFPGAVIGAPGDRSGFVKLQRVCGGGPGASTVPCDIAANSKTPFQGLFGSITPSDLHFERSHSGVPEINPARHRLLAQGLDGGGLVFAMEELMRMPSMSRICFIECSGNGWDNWKQAKPELNVQQTHGLISTSEWTGVPLAFVLEQIERGGKRATWMLAEGADGAAVSRSIPLTEKMRREGFLAYAQNGEPLRPANGYPLRLVLPGLEGNTHIKWLRRLKLGHEPFMTRWETAKYTRLRPDGKADQFVLVEEVNSVIMSPSGGMSVKPGFIEVRGSAWSGNGRISRVEVSADGGRNWKDALLQGPVLPVAQTTFRLLWNWDGKPAMLQSRATDETGQVQPTRRQIVDAIGSNAVYHFNGIQTWAINQQGETSNAFT